MLSFSICILFGIAFQATSGQNGDGNEKLERCIENCNTAFQADSDPNRPIDEKWVLCTDDCESDGYLLEKDPEGAQYPGNVSPVKDVDSSSISYPDPPQSDGCPNEIECNLNCRRNGYDLGICEGEICRCFIVPVDIPNEDLGRSSSQTCGCRNEKECKEKCIKRGFKDGVCEKDFCRCIERNISVSPIGCPDEERCLRACQKFGFTKGICKGPRCICSERPQSCFCSEDPREEKCESGPCHRCCQIQGYRYGLCVGDKDNICKCFQNPTENP